MPTILGANSDTAAYEISNSARFGMIETFLTRTQSDSESDTDRRKFTFSGWYKQTLQGSAGGWNGFWSAMIDSNNFTSLKITGDETLVFDLKVSGTNKSFTCDGVFRDPSAWYNIVVVYDSTEGAAADRLKIYVNGTQRTGTFSSDLSQNISAHWGDDASAARVGAYGNNTGNAYMHNGYMADVCMTVGYALAPTAFGRTDTNGVWIPKNPSITYSANGFFLEFKQTGTSQNSSGIGADTSGNDNHFAIDSDDIELGSTTDTPTNNFATMNPLTAGSNLTLREGNLQQYAHSSSDSAGCAATIMPDSGKWYIELYLESPSGGDYPFFGITDTYNLNRKGTHGTKLAAGFEIDGATNNQSTTNFGSITNTNTGWPSFSDNDIVQFALDLDNRKLWLGRNGTYINSGNPASGSNAQLAWTISDNTSVMMLGYDGSGGGGSTSRWNFGNPVFSISSGNADANGYGNFEYAPPSGYYALCTKNLAEYG